MTQIIYRDAYRSMIMFKGAIALTLMLGTLDIVLAHNFGVRIHPDSGAAPFLFWGLMSLLCGTAFAVIAHCNSRMNTNVDV